MGIIQQHNRPENYQRFTLKLENLWWPLVAFLFFFFFFFFFFSFSIDFGSNSIWSISKNLNTENTLANMVCASYVPTDKDKSLVLIKLLFETR